MLKINLQITNPWSDRFDPGWAWGKKLTDNKACEFQVYRSNCIVEATLEVTHRQDHAGVRLEFGILSYSVTFQIYDTRHWNYATQRWEIYDYKDDEL